VVYQDAGHHIRAKRISITVAQKIIALKTANIDIISANFRHGSFYSLYSWQAADCYKCDS